MVEPQSMTIEDPADQIRAKEIAQIESRLTSDHGGVILLHGRRGVGKAAVVSELIRRVQPTPNTVVLEGHTIGQGGGSFHPFAEIVRQAMSWAEQHGASDRLIDPVLPDIEAVLAHADAVDADAAAPSDARPSLEQKLGFFEGVRRLLAGIASRARLLAVVHDLERADSDTLELAAYLADNLFGDPALEPGNDRPGLLLLVLRDDRTTSDRARDFLATAKERRTIDTIRLDGLDLDGLRRYVQSPRVLRKLLDVSEGLPREIDELFEALPTNVEELFQRKLDALPAAARELISALAVFGQPASARVISAATGQAVRQVAQILSDQREAHVLERQIKHGEIKFGFARRSNLEVTLRATPAEDLARLHGGWARALAQEGGTGPALLAHHQLRSAEPTRGVPLAIKAAESHAVAGAFDAAAQLLEEALPHAKRELRLAILERLAELASLRGEPKAALRYVEQWKAALPAEEHGRVLISEAELKNRAGDYDRALATLQDARPLVEKTGSLADRVAVENAACEALYQLGALEQARKTGIAGLALVDSAGADAPAALRIDLLNTLGKIALAGDSLPNALELFRDTLALAQKSGLGHEEARALVNLGVAELRAGALGEAEKNLLLGVERARESNDLERLAFGNLNLGVLAHQRGELGLAIDRYRTCRSLFGRLGNRTQLARVLHNLGNLFYLVGDLARAQAHNDEALRLARAGGVERLVAVATTLDGIVGAERGDLEAAEAKLREAIVLQARHAPERSLETMLELGAIQLRTGDTQRAADTIAEVEEQLARTPDSHRQLAARAKLLRGRTLLSAGDQRAAGVLAETKAEIEALGERLLLRDAELALGEAHAAAGRRETARMFAGAALKIQQAIAAELPPDLKERFEAARAQREVVEVLASLDGEERRPLRPSTPPPATMTTTTLRPTHVERTQPPAIDRMPEWFEKYGSLVGKSKKLSRVFRILDRVSGSDDTVLIVGESGTGKELVAEAIHKNSPRAKGPFVKLNCAALVESLLLSELFGHERGSFTGAHQRKIGRFEMAAGGTLFLDEIGDISPKTQVALLRVLQEFEFERVGGGKPIKLEARVICATNRNLALMVREGTFREDLYYRLKGLAIELPPLRERPEDIGELAAHFLSKYAEESNTVAKNLSPAALGTLAQYRWPGNVRELENVIRSVALFADAPVIERSDFDEYRELFEDSPSFAEALDASQTIPPIPIPPAPPPPAASEDEPEDDGEEAVAHTPSSSGNGEADAALLAEIFARGVPLAELKQRIQDEAIAHALRVSKGNITRAADMLGMKRPRLSQIINGSEMLKQLCQGVGR